MTTRPDPMPPELRSAWYAQVPDADLVLDAARVVRASGGL